MKITASGCVHDGRAGPPHRRSCAFTTAYLARDGTLYVTGRWGSQRESLDGHPCIFASPDLGETWEMRHDGHGRWDWDGGPGENKCLALTELAPGEFISTSLLVDRSRPERPFVNPRTQGLLPMRVVHATSTDGARTWSPPRAMESSPHPGASTCTHAVMPLPGGVLAQPYEHWKEYDDPTPGKPGALLRFSFDGGATWPEYATVGRHPEHRMAYWDQRLETHPESGRLVAMFWTHDFDAGQDVDSHIAWGSADGRQWSEPRSTGLPGQHSQPLSLGGDRLLVAYPRRRTRPASSSPSARTSAGAGTAPATWWSTTAARAPRRGWGSGGPMPICGATWRAGVSAIPARRCCPTGRSSSSGTRAITRSRAPAGPGFRWSKR